MPDLERVGHEECQIHDQERPRHGRRLEDAPAPHLSTHHVEHDRRQRHQRRERDAVRAGEIARRLESEHQRDREDHQHLVHGRDVDLSDLA